MQNQIPHKNQRCYCVDNFVGVNKNKNMHDLQRHSRAPLHLHTAKFTPEEHVIELQKHSPDVGARVKHLPGLVHNGHWPLKLGIRFPVGNNIATTSSYLHSPFLTALPETIIYSTT